jgi:H+/Cl- antiporter ClcA
MLGIFVGCFGISLVSLAFIFEAWQERKLHLKGKGKV